MRDGQKATVIGGILVTVVTLVGFGTYTLLNDGGESGTGTVASTADGRPGGSATGTPSADEVREVSTEFLAAWEAGKTRAAAALTDDPKAARTALAALSEQASFTSVTLTQVTPSGETVPFTVDAIVGLADQQGEADFSYESELTVVRDADSGEAVVQWESAVIHPSLREGQSLATGSVADQAPVEVLDAEGGVLTAEEHPTLAATLADLRERYAEESGASAGTAMYVVDAQGTAVKRLKTLAEPVTGQVPSTIDPEIQQAAEEAVAGEDSASVVAIQPSTGAILAFANSPSDGYNTALQGSYAPGSTFKIVTSSLLIEAGLASADEQHPCPKYYTYGGWRFQNDDGFSIENGTFRDSFSRSCNTAFISQAESLSDDSLSTQAKEVFGLGLTWSVGTTTMDGSVPVQSDAQMAAELIGQGGVRVNPLNMASVSATVKNGSFLQPYLVPASFDDRELAQASRTMSTDTAAELRSLMNTTAVSGTAAEAMSGLTGDIGAKTGSAEVDGQDKPNAWFTAYEDDLAVAAVVPNSGHGGEFAGPIVADVLRAG